MNNKSYKWLCEIVYSTCWGSSSCWTGDRAIFGWTIFNNEHICNEHRRPLGAYTSDRSVHCHKHAVDDQVVLSLARQIYDYEGTFEGNT